MEQIRNLTLKKTMALYLCVALIASFFLSTGLTCLAEKIQKRIWSRYTDEEEVWEQIEMERRIPGLRVEAGRISSEEMTDMDNIIVESCDFIITWNVLLISVAACVMAMFLFYQNKLRLPLKILTESSEKIRENTLDFAIEYDNQDEMGQVCRSFEKMRVQLLENNKKMWQMIENEKNLRAAIAHDMRAPLTVIKGYQEMLSELAAEKEPDKESLQEMLKEERKQMERLQDFLNITQAMCRLEERKPEKQAVSYKALKKKLLFTVRTLCKEKGIQWKFWERAEVNELYGDASIMLEVLENLLTNSIRYAREEIEIALYTEQSFLVIEVSDDGEGFSEAFETLTKSYYHGEDEDSSIHFGLGLYLCRLFCEAHGGKLSLGNRETKGAYARAYFFIK